MHFKITEKEENWISEDQQKMEEPENWVDDDPQATEQQNAKLEKFLKIFSQKKVTLSLKYYNKTMCLYHNIKKNFQHYLCFLSFYIYFRYKSVGLLELI